MNWRFIPLHPALSDQIRLRKTTKTLNKALFTDKKTQKSNEMKKQATITSAIPTLPIMPAVVPR
ncbi:MAG: hypothetical protein WCD79_15775, partial [Chthoniobacteraceae bacterium]